ncbi:hypothetical protein PFLUV_G00018920 [Perca fluviatilis]|uniref:G-protein coupled receptors family 1 profile domain-containing protein n=1 Tax=Perca fluviatilis TaxID=8168 RepID=A0A6A5FEB9_PERFL|nr:hypothetical protein PFLUV_G00018920 [Perca fluviatilis]
MFNCTLENGTERDMRNTPYAPVFGSVMMLGLPLNAVSLWILLRCHSLKSPSVVFMVNLAISDLLLLISLPMRVYFYAMGTWPLGNKACICFTMLFRNNIRSRAIIILDKNNESTCFEFCHKLPSTLAYLQPVLVLTMLAVNIVSTALVSWTLHRHLNDSARINNKVSARVGAAIAGTGEPYVDFLPQQGEDGIN